MSGPAYEYRGYSVPVGTVEAWRHLFALSDADEHPLACLICMMPYDPLERVQSHLLDCPRHEAATCPTCRETP